jgi:adenylate cyclase class 2
MEYIETEVKFHLPDIKPIRSRILDLGADSKGRVFETNLRYENKQNDLIKNKSLLRLRKDAKTTLTFKSGLESEDNEFKRLRELEVEVSDFHKMKLILEALEFHKEQIYEKYRETLILNGATLCIDAMPFGDFLEIEGEKHVITGLAKKIGLDWSERITLNYLELFERLKKELGLPFSDITFANFEPIEIDLKKYMHLLYN